MVEIWNEASGTTAVSRSNKSNNSLGFRGTEAFYDKNRVKDLWHFFVSNLEWGKSGQILSHKAKKFIYTKFRRFFS